MLALERRSPYLAPNLPMWLQCNINHKSRRIMTEKHENSLKESFTGNQDMQYAYIERNIPFRREYKVW